MTFIDLAGVLTLVFMYILVVRSARKRWLRRRGLYPQPGQASMADVERLFKGGYRMEAIVCYREIFPQVGLAEAKAAVDALSMSKGAVLDNWSKRAG
ncbi:MAG: hypothetical protein ACO1QS_03305 [Verrucomicrobiota bacterium]